MRLLFYICALTLCSTLTLNGSGKQISMYEEFYGCLQNCAFYKKNHFDRNNYSDEFVNFDINMSDPNPQSDGCSLLHVAVGLNGCLVCIAELLLLGAAPYQLNKNTKHEAARTPIDLAYDRGHNQIAKFMERFFFRKISMCI